MNVTKQTLDIDLLIGREPIAKAIADTYQSYSNSFVEHRASKKELRNYIFATDTTTTTNSTLPWKNSTTIPKICQIRDNLHTNYMSAILPNSDWLKWEGDNKEAVNKNKRNVIEAYMRSKVRQARFDNEVSKLLYDYIDEGNAYATVEYRDESIVDESTGETQVGYRGPVVTRISPNDIVFDPSATSFKHTPKIIRSFKTLGELAKDVKKLGTEESLKAFEYATEARKSLGETSTEELEKADAFMVDGFGSLKEYASSNKVEVLTFYGDFYDIINNKLLENHIIQIIDRSFTLVSRPMDRWEAGSAIYHVGWRQRQDNLIAMGPLDNLVGMQYRIDHIENQKADMLDFVNMPMLHIRGEVEEFEWQPNGRIYSGDEGRVEVVARDVNVSNMNFEISSYENRMEEMAGAPKQALGFRSPGEKTAFEVQVLDQGANKIFLSKAMYFERQLLAPVLNGMLEIGRRNLANAELIKIPNPLGGSLFTEINREDISATGTVFPVGASHFAKNANALQTLIGVFNSPLGQDASVKVHFSGLKLAELIEDMVDLKQFDIVSDNVSVLENLKTQQLMQQGQQQVDLEGQTPSGIVEGDLDEDQI